MSEYHIGVDVASGDDVTVEERYMKPTAEYPQGSYLRLIAGKPDIATGWYEKEYPGHPSMYWHGGPPFVMFEPQIHPDIHLSEVRDWTEKDTKAIKSSPPNPTLKFDHVSIDLTDEEIAKMKCLKGERVEAGKYQWTPGKALKDCRVDGGTVNEHFGVERKSAGYPLSGLYGSHSS
jgi:hypothetical protein